MNDLVVESELKPSVIMTAELELPKRAAASRAMKKRKVAIYSEEAQKVFRRSYRITEKNLYAIDVLAGIMLSGEAAEKLLELVEMWMAPIRTDIQTEYAQLRVLYDEIKPDEDAGYSAPLEVTAAWATPLAKRYLEMILQLDHFLHIVHTLWLDDALTSNSVRPRTYVWVNRMMRLSGRIRSLSSLVRSEIDKINSGQKDRQAEIGDALHKLLFADLEDENTNPSDGAAEIPVEHDDHKESAKALATAMKLDQKKKKRAPDHARPADAPPDPVEAPATG